MGKATLTISILLVIFVLAILVLKTKQPSNPAMTYYQPTPAQTSIAPTSTPTPISSLPLTITAPTQASVSTSTITVSGQTSPQADVFVNETQLKANSQGSFSTIVTLDEGDNIIVVDVNDAEGNYVEKEIPITYIVQ
jgi:hypothetical protein